APSVTQSLSMALTQQDINPKLERRTADWVSAFVSLAAARAVADDAGGPSFLRQSLADAGIGEPERQQAFAALFSQYHALTPEMLAALERNPAFKPVEI